MRTPSLLLGLAAAACTVPAADGPTDRPVTYDIGETPDTATDAFAAAAATHDVPKDLLLALAMTETRLQMVEGHAEFPGQDPAFGVMALRGERLAEGARLAGLSEQEVRTDLAANVLAAAALLDAWATELQLDDRDDLSAWAKPVALFSGIQQVEHRRNYVWDEVYPKLQQGFSVEGYEVVGRKLAPDYAQPEPAASLAGASRPYAVWRPSPNQNDRPTGSLGDPAMVVIHTCEGGYSGCWSWLTNSGSGVSAHYVVNDDGSEISQLVHEDRRAWHVGATYDCANNDGVDCWRNGNSSNHFTIGIEHAGFANQSSWDPGLLDASAGLVCDITEDWGIPRDLNHIVAHGALQPYNRTDPGPNWPWASYLADIQAACGDIPGGSTGGGSTGGGTTAPPTGTQIVVDSNNGVNGPEGYIEVSSNWTSSTNVYGYYNTGYWAAPTAPVSDAAIFWFDLPSDGCYDVEAWWTAAWDRSPAAPFIAYDATGTEVGREYVDQTVGGSQWNPLGSWWFTSGWNEVKLSRWAATGDYVIADAVRVTESTSCPGYVQPVEIVIDNDPALNDPAVAEVTYRGAWNPTDLTPGFHGDNYAFKVTSPTSTDRVVFRFFLDQPATLAVDGWWTAGTNRATDVPFAAFGPGGLLGFSRVDQTVDGSQWTEVGVYDFDAGWNKVVVGARASGGVAIADAIRVRELP